MNTRILYIAQIEDRRDPDSFSALITGAFDNKQEAIAYAKEEAIIAEGPAYVYKVEYESDAIEDRRGGIIVEDPEAYVAADLIWSTDPTAPDVYDAHYMFNPYYGPQVYTEDLKENTSSEVIYAVNSDLDDEILYAEFETEDAAIEYAKRNLNKLPFVDELQVSRDADGEIDDVFEYKTIWDHTMADSVEDETEDDYWDDLAAMYDDSEKHAIGATTWFESVDTDELVETLEENEDTVECKECFDLFPKADCIKVDFGYICPTCAEGGTVSEEDLFKMDFPEYEKMSAGNDMIPDEPMIPTESSEEVPPVETEVEIDPISTPEEAVPFLVKDEEEAIAGYEKAAEVVADSDLENKDEILEVIDHIKEEEEEHIEELIELVDTKEEEVSEDENDSVSEDEIEEIEDPEEELIEEDYVSTAYDTGRLTKEELYDHLVNKGDIVDIEAGHQGYGFEDTGAFSDGGYYSNSVVSVEYDNGIFKASETYMSESGADKAGDWDFETESFDELWDEIMNTFKPEDLVEHVNEEHPAVESDQELEGTDNAEVKCKTNPVVTHSKDDFPVDSCDHEMLTEATTDELNQIFKLCREIGIMTGRDLNRFIEDEVAEGQNLLDALKAYCDDPGAALLIGEDLKESAVLTGVATGVIVDVVKRIMDKFGAGKKKSKWYDFRKYVIEKTPEGILNIWNHDSEQVASDLKTLAAAKEKIKELNQKAKEEKKAAKQNKPTESDQEEN